MIRGPIRVQNIGILSGLGKHSIGNSIVNNNVINTRHFFKLAGFGKGESSGGSESGQSYIVNKKFSHSQSLIYELVSGVDKYDQFIPYCTKSFINERDDKGEPIKGGLRVGFKQFDEEFVCDLTCNKPQLVIAESITHSLFKYLYTEWKIDSVDEKHCKAQLTLRYEFKSELYNTVSALFAQHVATLMTKAFERRAYEVAKSRK
ncbi:hypothetical protein B5S31_g3844 [[Candida] boidinii]|nr:hypothetical protein B5S31_g3844 [[Candida] boidinii]GME73628.1 unnamed protein product [[Candida] boidinii]